MSHYMFHLTAPARGTADRPQVVHTEADTANAALEAAVRTARRTHRLIAGHSGEVTVAPSLPKPSARCAGDR
ncbi:MAG: hypothetical protein ACRDRL_08580 [Sciscionella sp.]